MKKTICIVTSIPFFEPVIRNRMFALFEVLLQNDIKVQCVCPKSQFDLALLPKGVILKEIDIELNKPEGFFRRGLKELRDARLLLIQAKKLSNDAILVTIPSMFLTFISPIYLKNKLVFLDIRDLTWEYLSESSLIKRTIKRVFRFLFKHSISFYKIVSVTNETELNYVKEIDKNKSPIHVSNGIRHNQFLKLNALTASEENKFTISYIGNIGLAQDLTTLIEAARKLPNFSFRIVGTGIEESKIRELINKYELKNVILTGLVSWEEVINNYNLSHVLYAQLAPDFSGAMPSKLYEYLATGKYVLYGGEGQAMTTLAVFDNNCVIPPCNVNSLVENLNELSQNMNRTYLSQSNKDIIERQYIRENSAQKLVDRIVLALR